MTRNAAMGGIRSEGEKPLQLVSARAQLCGSAKINTQCLRRDDTRDRADTRHVSYEAGEERTPEPSEPVDCATALKQSAKRR